jgi:hypothetical protein
MILDRRKRGGHFASCKQALWPHMPECACAPELPFQEPHLVLILPRSTVTEALGREYDGPHRLSYKRIC